MSNSPAFRHENEASQEPWLITIAEAARLLRVSRSQAYVLARRRVIPTVRMGGAMRVPLSRLREIIDEQLNSDY